MVPRQIQAVGCKRTGRKASNTRKSRRAATGWARSQSTDLGLGRVTLGLHFPGLFEEGRDEILLLHFSDELAFSVDEALARAASHAKIRILGLARAVDHTAHDGVGDVLVVDLFETFLDLVGRAIE